MDRWRPALGYAWAMAAALAATLAGLAMSPVFDLVNIAMVYVLGVAIVSLRQPRGPAIASALAAILAFDWVFVPPPGTFRVDDAQYVFTFAVLVVLALMISRLVADIGRKAREQASLEIAAETARIRATMLASISHDLRTPLALITGVSSSLAERGEEMSPAERAELSGSLYRRSRQMADELDKILDMTRLDAATVLVDRDWISLQEIAAVVLEEWRPALAHHRVLVEMPADLPLIRGDAVLIGKALANLLENVVRHTPAGTVVRVRATSTASEVALAVEDRGGDFPEGAHEGMGLGLAICRAIVRLHEGRWLAERLDGGGTAFHMGFPREDEPAVPREAQPA